MTVTAAWESKLSHPSGDFEFSPLAQAGEVTVKLLRLRRGKADPIITTRDVGLWDGSLEEIVRDENRDVELLVVFDGPDSDALALKEEALALQVRKGRQEWTWTPPDGVGATTVFDVLWGDLELVDDDDLWDVKELLGKRVWRLKLRCRPFGRGTTLQTTTAGGGSSSSSTQINACDSATGWTSTTSTINVDSTNKAEGTASLELLGGTVTDELVNAYWSVYKRTTVADATLSGLSTDLSSTPYPTILVDNSYGIEAAKVRMWVDGVEVPSIGAPVYVTNGFYRYTFRSTDASVSTVKVEVTKVTQVYILPNNSAQPQGGDRSNIRIEDLRRGAAPASSSSTGREITAQVPILGSARTEATIAVSHPTNGLGDVFIYSSPKLAVAGYTPDLSRYCTAKAGSTSAPIAGSTGGGALSTTPGTTVFRIPAATLPEGSYLLFVAGAGGGAPTAQITVTARLKAGSTVLAERQYLLTPSRLGSSGSAFAVLGQLNLPPAAVPEASAAFVELDMTLVGSSFAWDEFFLCHLSDAAAFTVVQAGGTGTAALGTANNRLWIDPPSIDRPAGGVYLGTDVTRADAYHAGAAAPVWSQHRAEPPTLSVFVANTGGANPTVAASHFDRVLFHAVRRS